MICVQNTDEHYSLYLKNDGAIGQQKNYMIIDFQKI